MKYNFIHNAEKIFLLSEKLGFYINELGRVRFSITHKDDISYEIYINYIDETGHLRKVENFKFSDICSPTKDLDKVYESLCDIFKYELRKDKIDKILDGRVERFDV